jgi:hypothetical protein
MRRAFCIQHTDEYELMKLYRLTHLRPPVSDTGLSWRPFAKLFQTPVTTIPSALALRILPTATSDTALSQRGFFLVQSSSREAFLTSYYLSNINSGRGLFSTYPYSLILVRSRAQNLYLICTLKWTLLSYSILTAYARLDFES